MSISTQYVGGLSGMSPDERHMFYGDSTYRSAPGASLMWGGPNWSPAVGFHRLLPNSQGRLYPMGDAHSMVRYEYALNSIYFEIPVSGRWGIYILQAFGTSSTAHRSAGLSTSDRSADNRVAWADTSIGRFAQSYTETYLMEGDRLYPWVYVGAAGASLTASDSGLQTHYSVRFLRDA